MQVTPPNSSSKLEEEKYGSTQEERLLHSGGGNADADRGRPSRPCIQGAHQIHRPMLHQAGGREVRAHRAFPYRFCNQPTTHLDRLQDQAIPWRAPYAVQTVSLWREQKSSKAWHPCI